MSGSAGQVKCPGCGVVVETGAGGALCPDCVETGVNGKGHGHGNGHGNGTGNADGNGNGNGHGRSAGPPRSAGLITDLRRAFEHYGDALADSKSTLLDRRGEADFALSGASGPMWSPGHFELTPGTTLGEYGIIEEIGRGGMGVVYRAEDPSLGREVALKILPDYARHSPMARQRFLAESRAAARIHHTNVVTIHARGEHDDQHYYAMDLIDGPSLDRVLRAKVHWFSTEAALDDDDAAAAARPRPGSADYRRLARLLAGLADGVACAHEQGVLHRDIKPHNVLVNRERRLYLTDFGLARLADEPHLTEPGALIGTPVYLSPEQLRGDTDEVDHRADVYAIGATLYEILTHRRPFAGRTRDQLMHEVLAGTLVPPRRIVPDLPLPLETICLRAMERDRDRRHPTAAALAEDLRRFSEGRPILSRRPGPVVRAGRWLQHRRGPASLVAALVLIAALIAGWSATAAAGRQREARHLLNESYETLAYIDYRDAALVADDLDRAESLGASADDLALARALASLGTEEHPEAIATLEGLIAQEPDEIRARYLLAWALWRTGAFDDSLAVFADADTREATLTADAWFFRGLAGHFDDPDEALESYRRAIELRAADQRFYPQAALHLARAHNQQMYATRRIEPFFDAERALRPLAEDGVYGAYPHYLLSIAHRLAAEIYSGSEGTRGVDAAEGHYAESLAWARRGQELEAGYDRPITAEAACLESMTDYEAALEARTRAIHGAARDRAAWEGLHYRWRLHYWLGSGEDALEDLAACQAFDPDDVFYTHVYPALVLADLGRHAEALTQARAIARDQRDVDDVLWSATTLRLIGHGGEATRLLETHAGSVDFAASASGPRDEAWLRALYDHCAGADGLAVLQDMADRAAAPWELWGEAHFHTAARRLAEGDRDAAAAGFRRAYRCFDGERGYTYHGKLVWRRLVLGRNDAADTAREGGLGEAMITGEQE